ncbi:hypothetical protein QBC43DRAFT_318890 [Cladorrhinum sp. PSN259]|nr:hypothetical protein QBC43DRAFT_318890 [Cladorrhinum sp. PSN259]
MAHQSRFNRGSLLDTGISVVYEPTECKPVVDIVIVHGLQGHPYKTWTFSGAANLPESDASSERSETPKKKLKLAHRNFRGLFSRSLDLGKAAETSESGSSGGQNHVFWPADLLPRECPNSRILVFGYDSMVTKYMASSTNKNSIVSHSKDLLFALQRETVADRPLIFVAHSLGGIVVKEMLSRSSMSVEPQLRNIVESTAAVLFLGTPHRGSQDLAAMGEWFRSIISALRIETTPAILNALGLKTTDLERAQEAFSQIWHKYGFQVKTFQEGLGLTGVNLGVLGNKVVPDHSSLIGDYRERAETLQANHMDMCRFSGANDPNYRKVAGEIRSIYGGIVEGRELGCQHADAPLHVESFPVNEDEAAFLRTLWFPAANTRFRAHGTPIGGTCSWLFDHPTFQSWVSGKHINYHKGLLLLKGQPGAGKSTLMGEAFRKAIETQNQTGGNHLAAGFFFNAKGDELERSAVGLFRSLLCQLLPHHREDLKQRTSNFWKDVRLGLSSENSWTWLEPELKSMFQEIVLRRPAHSGKLVIFIDGLDECFAQSIRGLAMFWREITMKAYSRGIRLHVCISSRHYPLITLSECLQVVVERHNQHDIETYVNHRFTLVAPANDSQLRSLKHAILSRSGGVFLWVVLAIDDILQLWDDGEDIAHLQRKVDHMPQQLSELYASVLSSATDQQRYQMFQLFQWATLAVAPLRLHEWHHILGWIQIPMPESIKEWRESKSFTADDDQLERKIRSISKGLVEVKTTRAGESHENDIVDKLSICAGAGSLNLEAGETRIVQVIHETVLDFFLRGRGFAILNPTLEVKPVGQGHLSIMSVCLNYLWIKELDELVLARLQFGVDQTVKKEKPSKHAPISETLGERETSLISSQTTDRMESSTPANDASLETLHKKLAEVGQGINLETWLALTKPVATQAVAEDEVSLGLSSRASIRRSQVLEDYPALLSYALHSMFIHAKLAQDDGAYSTPLVQRFQDGGWTRWRLLREDIDPQCSLPVYASANGLHTWITVGEKLRKAAADSLHIGLKDSYCNPDYDEHGPEGNDHTHTNSDLYDRLPATNISKSQDRYEGYRGRLPRKGSVASFSSASSHG